MLGTVAGNLALTLGARGGVYIAGGIVPKLGTAFAESGFRTRFEAKGRFRPRPCENSEIEFADRKFVSILSIGKINTLMNTVGRSQ